MHNAGIEPFVTVHHYDMPQVLEQRDGGWLSPLLRYDFYFIFETTLYLELLAIKLLLILQDFLLNSLLLKGRICTFCLHMLQEFWGQGEVLDYLQ